MLLLGTTRWRQLRLPSQIFLGRLQFCQWVVKHYQLCCRGLPTSLVQNSMRRVFGFDYSKTIKASNFWNPQLNCWNIASRCSIHHVWYGFVSHFSDFLSRINFMRLRVNLEIFKLFARQLHKFLFTMKCFLADWIFVLYFHYDYLSSQRGR